MKTSDSLKNMTLRQKVCQMLLPAFRNWVPGDPKSIPVQTMVHNLGERHFCGIIIFDGNIVSLDDISEFMRRVDEENTLTGGLPYMFAIDQEGGRVSRLVGGTRLSGNMALGASGDEGLAFESAEVIGTELSDVGFNLDFAPDMDVNDNPANPVIGVRSFSDDPQIVSKLGCSFMKGLQAHGVMAVAKHFPGHGNTVVDSHIGLPVVDKSLEELRKTELVPFEAATGIADMIMTAHIQFPQIEKETYVSKETGETVFLPATLSRKIITGLLREGMGFDGVVVTDDMCMGAIARHFDPLDAAALAINAGADIILMPVNLSTPEGFRAIDDYIDGIVNLVEMGEIPNGRIDESVERILALKKKYCTARKSMGISDWRSNIPLRWRTAFKAVTMLKNKDGLLPLSGNEKVLVVCPSDFAYEAVGESLAFMLRSRIIPQDNRIEVRLEKEPCTLPKGYEVYVLISEGRPKFEVPEDFGGRTVFISAALPYDTADATSYDAVLACYGYEGAQNLCACVSAVFGTVRPSGKLPVDIPGSDGRIIWKRGFGLI